MQVWSLLDKVKKSIIIYTEISTNVKIRDKKQTFRSIKLISCTSVHKKLPKEIKRSDSCYKDGLVPDRIK